MSTKGLTLPIQAAGLRGRWGFDCQLERKRLVATGVIRPHALAREYRVRIEYEPGKYPRAWVDDPPLRPRTKGGSIKHTYPGPRPCLFHPPGREWTSAMQIADTILPWLMAWLFFYEVWHATGEWLGGGIEHSAPKDEEDQAGGND